MELSIRCACWGYHRSRPTIRSTDRSPREPALTDSDRRQNLSHHSRAKAFGPADARQTQDDHGIKPVGELQIIKPQGPAFTWILVEADKIILGASVVFDIIVCSSPDGHTVWEPYSPRGSDELDLGRGGVHFVEGDRIPNVTTPWTIATGGVPLSYLKIPRVALLNPPISVELGQVASIGVKERIDDHVLRERRVLPAQRVDRQRRVPWDVFGCRIADKTPNPDIREPSPLDRRHGGSKRLRRRSIYWYGPRLEITRHRLYGTHMIALGESQIQPVKGVSAGLRFKQSRVQ